VTAPPPPGWDEPPAAVTPRGWLMTGGTCTGFYLDYGPGHYRAGHETRVSADRVVSFCKPGDLCRECEPGNILAVRYPDGPGTAKRSRYTVTAAQAREYVETGSAAEAREVGASHGV
jgi:hypothetical protein